MSEVDQLTDSTTLDAATPKSRRQNLYVNSPIQDAMVVRVAAYWIGCLLFLVIPAFAIHLFRDPQIIVAAQSTTLWSMYWPVLLMAVLLLPLIVFDTLQFSNRIVGPITRLHQQMEVLASGEKPEEMAFRKDDFWGDLPESFNRVALRIRTQETKSAGLEPESSDDHGDEYSAISRVTASTS